MMSGQTKTRWTLALLALASAVMVGCGDAGGTEQNPNAYPPEAQLNRQVAAATPPPPPPAMPAAAGPMGGAGSAGPVGGAGSTPPMAGGN